MSVSNLFTNIFVYMYINRIDAQMTLKCTTEGLNAITVPTTIKKLSLAKQMS